MTASSSYDIRLTSATGMSAYLVFIVRSAPLAASSVNTFIPIQSFELRDQSNTIVGINTTNDLSTELSLLFQGDIFNYKSIYVIPFLSFQSSTRSRRKSSWILPIQWKRTFENLYTIRSCFWKL